MEDRFESIEKGLNQAIAWRQGKKTKAQVRTYTALDVAQIRKKTKMTQREFSESFSIPLPTLRQWEQGKRAPHGAAQALLKIISKNPSFALQALN